MWYAIYRNKDSKVAGFIVNEEDQLPKEFKSEEEATNELVNHILFPVIEFIEL